MLLSRFMPKDWQKEVLPEVERLFNSASPQHEARQWEYSQALRASRLAISADFIHEGCPQSSALDVGGAGSPFEAMLGDDRTWRIKVIDPAAGTCSIEAYSGEPVEAVFSISVLEHVEKPEPFLQACVKLLKPEGLLFLTCDAWDREGPDTAHFNHMRQRIYNPKSLLDLSEFICSIGMEVVSPVDLSYPGHNLYGSYNFCSLAFLKIP